MKSKETFSCKTQLKFKGAWLIGLENLEVINSCSFTTNGSIKNRFYDTEDKDKYSNLIR